MGLLKVFDGNEYKPVGVNIQQIITDGEVYVDEAEVDSSVAPVNADTVGGYTVDLLLNKIYPVGSIYMSTNATSPATLFGGTWERIKDTFLLSAGDTYAAGVTGGEAEHTLTVDEMPKHQHGYNSYQNGYPSQYTGGDSYKTPVVSFNATYEGSGVTNTQSNYTGGSQPHNNMPPYLAVYMWERTA